MPNPNYEQERRQEKDRRFAKNQATMVKMVQRWASLHGGPPKVSDWRHVRDPAFIAKHGHWPSFLTAARYSPDGTWDGIIRLAGFEPRGRGQPGKWTDGD